MRNKERSTIIIRSFRNQKLQKTDAFMGQIDRYSQKQIDQLKAYRQDLRDMINKEPIVFPEEPEFIHNRMLSESAPLPKSNTRTQLPLIVKG